MRNWQKSAPGPRKIGVLLFESFSNHCLANAVEPLRAANTLLRREAYAWEFLTLDGASVTSSSGLPVGARRALGRSGGGDVLFVISSYGLRRSLSPATLRGLRAAAERFDTLVGMDTGSWLLAAAGLLDGQPATIHWEVLDRFREAFPEVIAQRRRVVAQGRRWSCGGAMTAFELVARLIGNDLGEALRLEVEELFMAGQERGLPDDTWPPAASKLVSAALAVMRESLEDPLSIPDVAAAVGAGRRVLERRFRAELGAEPRGVYRRLRLAEARRLVEQTALPVAEVALRCGYRDASAMTRAFRAEFGASPRDLRAGAGETLGF